MEYGEFHTSSESRPITLAGFLEATKGDTLPERVTAGAILLKNEIETAFDKHRGGLLFAGTVLRDLPKAVTEDVQSDPDPVKLQVVLGCVTGVAALGAAATGIYVWRHRHDSAEPENPVHDTSYLRGGVSDKVFDRAAGNKEGRPAKSFTDPRAGS